MPTSPIDNDGAPHDLPERADIEFLYALGNTDGYWQGTFCSGRFTVEIWGPDETQVLVTDNLQLDHLRYVAAAASVHEACGYAAATIGEYLASQSD